MYLSKRWNYVSQIIILFVSEFVRCVLFTQAVNINWVAFFSHSIRYRAIIVPRFVRFYVKFTNISLLFLPRVCLICVLIKNKNEREMIVDINARIIATRGFEVENA